jgi:hypothetical protein
MLPMAKRLSGASVLVWLRLIMQAEPKKGSPGNSITQDYSLIYVHPFLNLAAP